MMTLIRRALFALFLTALISGSALSQLAPPTTMAPANPFPPTGACNTPPPIPAPPPSFKPSFWIWNYLPSSPSALTGVTPIPPNIRQSLYQEIINSTSPFCTTFNLKTSTVWGIAASTAPAGILPLSAIQKSGDAVLNVEHGDLILAVQTDQQAMRFTTTPPPPSGVTPPPATKEVERMTITTDGYVGIGKNNPAYKLVVAAMPPSSGVNPGTIMQVYDSSATYGGIAFTSAPGVDFSIGKKTSGSDTYFQIRKQNGNELVTVDVAGKVGIGTSVPTVKLEARGNCMLGANDGTSPTMLTLLPSGNGGWWNLASVGNGGKLLFSTGNKLSSGDGSTAWSSAALAMQSSGEIGIGTLDPADRLHLAGGAFRISRGTAVAQLALAPNQYDYSNVSSPGDLVLRTHDDAGSLILSAQTASGTIRLTTGLGTAEAERMRIQNNGAIVIAGDVGIGVDSVHQKKLVVNGLVYAKGARITLASSWPDYVFADDYNLMPLPELERTIRRQGHLPDVPSASEVQSDGIELGEMQGKLLKKVEELSLYIIDQEKRLKKLERENEELHNIIQREQ